MKFVVLSFYGFMLFFLDFTQSSWLKKLLIFGVFFVSVGLITNLLRSVAFFRFVNDFYIFSFMYVDLFILLALIIHVYKIQKGYYKFIWYGLLFVVLCAFLIYFGNKFFDLKNIGLSISILQQLEIIIGFTFFYLAILKKEHETLVEANLLEKQMILSELEVQKNIEKERERISNDMHDDIGAGISALKLQAEFLKQKIKDESSRNDIDDLLKTAGEMNTSMRELLWSLNTENNNLGDLLLYIDNYGELFFNKTKISFTVHASDINPKTEITTEKRRNLFLCLKEAFNNAYKHSNAESVFVKFSQSPKNLFVELQDDGVGLPQDYIEGHGLKNMNTRMQEVGGKFEILKTEKGIKMRYIVPL